MKLVEPLDLTISKKTLDKGIIDAADAVKWDTSRVDDNFKQANPYVAIKLGNMLVTSVMLVLKKNKKHRVFSRYTPLRLCCCFTVLVYCMLS